MYIDEYVSVRVGGCSETVYRPRPGHIYVHENRTQTLPLATGPRN